MTGCCIRLVLCYNLRDPIQGICTPMPKWPNRGGGRVGGGVHDSYTFQCGLVEYFTSLALAWAPDRRDRRLFSVSSERHWQSGVNGIAKVPKRGFPQVCYTNVLYATSVLYHIVQASS